jgi:ankyrin repeat protein
MDYAFNPNEPFEPNHNKKSANLSSGEDDLNQINKSHSIKEQETKSTSLTPRALVGTTDLSNIQPGTVLDKDQPFCEDVFRLILLNDVNNLRSLLKRESQIDLLRMKDARQFTVLSFAAYKNSEECLMTLYNHALELLALDQKPASIRVKLATWVNSTTDDELTALHFATYHGNIELI